MGFRNRLKVRQAPQAPKYGPGYGGFRAEYGSGGVPGPVKVDPSGYIDVYRRDHNAARFVQTKLREAGYQLAVDGIFGQQSETAYRDFVGKNTDNLNILAQQKSVTLQVDHRNRDNVAATAEAEAARQSLTKLADEYATQRTAAAKRAGAQLRQVATDRLRYDNVAVAHTWRTIQKERAAYQREQAHKSKPKGLKKVALGAVHLLGAGAEELQQAYYASKHAQLRGGGLGTQLAAFGGGLPGAGGLVGKGTRKDVEAVNSRAERDVLTRKGELASFGEFVSGKALDKLNPAQRKHAGGFFGKRQLPTAIRGAVSAGSDAGFQLGADPLNLVLGGAGELRKVGETAGEAGLRTAGQTAGLSRFARTGRIEAELGNLAGSARAAGRERFLATRTGEALLDKGEVAIRANQDVASLRRAIPGLAAEPAERVVSAARDGGIGAGRAQLAEEFALGKWSPKIGLGRQALGGTAGVGRAIRPADKLAPVRGFVRGTGGEAATVASRKAGQVIAHGLDEALVRARTFLPDIAPSVRSEVAGLSVEDRLTRLADIADSSGHAGFRDAVSSEVGGVIKDAGTRNLNAIPPAKAAAVEERLSRLEAAAFVLEGKAGDDAAKQFATELSKGYLPGSGTARKTVEEAAANRGLKLPQGQNLKPTQKNITALRNRIAAEVPDELKGAFLDDLDNLAASKKGLGRLEAALSGLKHGEVMDEAIRLADNAGERAAQAVVDKPFKPGLGVRSVLRGPGRALLDIMEPADISAVPFEKGASAGERLLNRVDALDRWANALGLDDISRSSLRRAGEAVQTEDELYGVVRTQMRNYAVRVGVDPADLVTMFDESLRAYKSSEAATRAFAAFDGEALRDEVQTVAQRVEHVPLPDPADVRRTVNELRAAEGSTRAGLKLRASNVASGKVATLLKKGHKLWKFSVVTNAYMPLAGGAAGFIGTDGSFGKRAKNAGVGFAIGMFGPTRYVLRVAGMEEKLRYLMERGFTPQEWIPGVSKWARRRGLELPFVSGDAVRATSIMAEHLSTASRHITSIADDWVVLGRKQSRFVDGWWRVFNWQIHPESDELARLVLNERAGMMTAQEVDTAAKAFLTGTEDGRIIMRRLKGGLGGASKWDEALARYRTFIEHYVPTPELANARLLAGDAGTKVDRAVLKDAVKAGTSPEFVHAQRTWLVPSNVKDALNTRNQLMARFVLEGPTTKFNREPLAEWLYRDEFLRLRGQGITATEAQALAGEHAVERTNAIMFQINDESRFAKKIDWVAPFQQPREELIRVWGKLVVSNPGRAVRMTRGAALAFNAGVDKGVFRKDEVSGEWVLSVPGSGYLGSRLFGTVAGFDANLRDLLFFGQGAYGVNIIPSPGGPYWAIGARAFFNAHPGVYEDMNPTIRQLLFPYGAQGEIAPGATNRLWMAMAGSVPPWEFASREEQQNTLNRMHMEVYLQLYWDHLKKTGEVDWEPSPEEVAKASKHLFQAWAFFRSTFPAAPHPVMPSAGEVEAIKKAYVDPGTGKLDYEGLITDHPGVAPFFRARTEYVGPDDLKHWTQDRSNRAEEFTLHYRRYLSLDKFRSEFKQYRQEQAAYAERDKYFAEPNPIIREQLLSEWRQRNPDLAARSHDSYERDKELWRITNTYPQAQRTAAIDRWRKEYGVTHTQYLNLRKKQDTFGFKSSPWREARDTEDVVDDVQAQVHRGFNEDAYVANLQPAEQVRYWSWKIGELSYSDNGKNNNNDAVLAEYYRYKRARSDLFKTHPELRGTKPKTPWEKEVEKWRGDVYAQISATYAEVDRVRAAMDAAAKAKDWTTYYALKDKRTALYDQVRAIQNRQYRELPELADYQNDVRAAVVFGQNAKKTGQDIEFIPSNEEASYLNMTPAVREAYVRDLTDKMSLPSGEKGKRFWEWLTDFQRDLLETNLPADQVAQWKNAHPGTTAPGGAGGKGGKGFGGKFYDGHDTIGSGAGELAFALEMFKQYNKRPAGAKAPAGYQEYLDLPNNPAVRSQYLKSHPQVAAWIKDGPLANMPELERMMVVNIMVKYGRWDGELRTSQEITDIAFAREQLARWNKRTGDRPEAYDTWLNMPSGVAKAEFLRSHPEVKEWIGLGPMSNMPEEYRDVVRDIMQRYGEWTQRQDPLGDVITGYYSVPAFARKDYLAKHPELVEYWAALRSPEENRMHDLANQYFAIPNPAARRMFLSVHPELGDYFVTSRTKRYEKFLNKVAQFMGTNPELFKEYLTRQEDILGELLHRYAEGALVREAPRLTNVSTTAGRGRGGSSEGGRRRAA